MVLELTFLRRDGGVWLCPGGSGAGDGEMEMVVALGKPEAVTWPVFSVGWARLNAAHGGTQHVT